MTCLQKLRFEPSQNGKSLTGLFTLQFVVTRNKQKNNEGTTLEISAWLLKARLLLRCESLPPACFHTHPPALLISDHFLLCLPPAAVPPTPMLSCNMESDSQNKNWFVGY